MTDAALADLVARLERLEERPVAAHVTVLRDIHEALVRELDELATRPRAAEPA